MEPKGDSESTLLKYDEQSQKFKVIQGYGVVSGLPSKPLPTRNPSQVLTIYIHNARYVLFVNTFGDKFGIDGDNTHSYLYKFDQDSEQLELVEQLLTFNPLEGK